ncbi:MAG: hypothetical protein ACR2OU_10410 [Thermomicrobiales bacterium]
MSDRETINIGPFAKLIGVSRPVAYQLAREDRLQVPVIRIGNRLVVSKRAVEDLLNRTRQKDDDRAA